MLPTVIISVGGAMGIPQPPPAPNIATELSPTVPLNRVKSVGLDLTARRLRGRRGRGTLKNAAVTR